MKKPPHSSENAALFRQLAPPELKKGDLRKLQIVEAAIECIAANGWLGTNYATVGKACNMKRPHVAYHYPEWDDLMTAVFKLTYATGAAIVADYLREAPPGPAQLRKYIEGTLHWLTKHPKHAAVITLLWHVATVDEKHRALSSELKRLGTERVFAILNGPTPPDRRGEPWRKALAIHGMLVGRCVEVMSTDLGIPASLVVSQLVAEAQLLLGAKGKGGR